MVRHGSDVTREWLINRSDGERSVIFMALHSAGAARLTELAARSLTQAQKQKSFGSFLQKRTPFA
jgi:hypothetical protein